MARIESPALDKATRDFLDRVALDLRDRNISPAALTDALVQDAIRQRLEREAAIISALFPMGGPKPPAIEAWLKSLQREVGQRAGATWADPPATNQGGT